MSMDFSTISYFHRNHVLIVHLLTEDEPVNMRVRALKFEADINAKDKRRTPIFYAIQNSIDMVKLFLDDNKVNDWDIFRQVLLHGTEEILGLLVNKSLLEIQSNSPQGAISTTNYEVNQFHDTKTLINTFLQHEQHLSHMQESYPCLILFAAKLFDKDILQIVLDDCRKNLARIKQEKIENKRNIEDMPRAPEEINIQGPFGETALLFAAKRRLVKVVRLLLELGADPNCHDVYYFTPLHFASLFEDEEMCQLLLDFNANPNLTSHKAVTPLHLVCGDRYYYRFRIEEINYYNDVNEEYNRYTNVHNPEIMKMLLKSGADPEKDLFIYTCVRDRLEELKILSEFGANIRALDSDGNSLLHDTIHRVKSCEIVEFLLEKGNEVDLKNNKNETPLLILARNMRGVSSRLVECLVHRGANVNTINDLGQTALFFAVNGNSNAVESLLELGADWSILGKIDETCLSHFRNCLYKTQKTLISFIALKEKELSNHIKFYVGNSDQYLTEALEYFQKSKLEIVEMKKTSIVASSRISYFDILAKDFYRSVQIVKNLDSGTTFDSDKFPCYESLLDTRFRMAEESMHFVDETFDFILKYTNLHPEIVEVIMSYFGVRDFQVFGRTLHVKSILIII